MPSLSGSSSVVSCCVNNLFTKYVKLRLFHTSVPQFAEDT